MASKKVLESTLQCVVEAQADHIKSLKAEVERLAKLVQILSDDKYFAPQVAPQNTQDVETYTPFTANDMKYEVEPATPEMAPEEPPAVDLDAELERLEQAHKEFLKTRK